MSRKKVMEVTCDRCGHKEHLEQVRNSPLDELNFEQLSDGWGNVRYQGKPLDMCPSCHEKCKVFFDGFVHMENTKTGGPFG